VSTPSLLHSFFTSTLGFSHLLSLDPVLLCISFSAQYPLGVFLVLCMRGGRYTHCDFSRQYDTPALQPRGGFAFGGVLLGVWNGTWEVV
jgi:hypothetical protein